MTGQGAAGTEHTHHTVSELVGAVVDIVVWAAVVMLAHYGTLWVIRQARARQLVDEATAHVAAAAPTSSPGE